MPWSDRHCRQRSSDKKVMATYTGSAQKLLTTGAIVLSDSVVPASGEQLLDGFDGARTQPVYTETSLSALPIPSNWSGTQWNNYIAANRTAGVSDGVTYLQLVRIIQNGTAPS